MTTRKLCFCDARIQAMNAGTFKWSYPYGAWFSTETPTRSMSQVAAYYAFVERGQEFPHEDHRGEPYQYFDCPWCGNSLPGTTESPPPFFGGQADGEGAE